MKDLLLNTYLCTAAFTNSERQQWQLQQEIPARSWEYWCGKRAIARCKGPPVPVPIASLRSQGRIPGPREGTIRRLTPLRRCTMHSDIKTQEAPGHSSARCSLSRDWSPVPEGMKRQTGIKASNGAKLGIFLAIPTY